MSLAWRPLYDVGQATFVPSEPGSYLFIIWNLYLTDKLTKLRQNDLKEANIQHIIAILPSKADFEALATDIGDISYTVLEYGGEHTPSVNLDEFLRLGTLIDNYARGLTYSETKRNVLVFCNNGYQRSLPFLCYYMTQFHKTECPTISDALKLLCASIPGYMNERLALTEKIEPLLAKKV